MRPPRCTGPRPDSVAERRSRRAFTLVETLAVVALLAITMAVGTVHLSGGTRQARIDAALHTLTLADAAARSLAMSGRRRPAMTTTRDGAEIFVTDQRGDEVLWRRPLASSVTARLILLGDEPGSTLLFDPAGRCPDHARVVVYKSEVVRRVLVSGVTGWSTPVAEQAP